MEKLAKKVTKKISVKKKVKTKINRVAGTRVLKPKKLLAVSRPAVEKVESETYTFPLLSQKSREKKKTYYILGVVTLFLGCLFIAYAEVKNNILGLQHGVEIEIDARKPASAAESEDISSKAALKETVLGSTLEKSELLKKDLESVQTLSFLERVKYWSSRLEKDAKFRKQLSYLTQYKMLEGAETIIPKAYNSTTYLETVIALSKSNQPHEFLENLFQYRYKEARVSFFYRNHFIEGDWIANNQKSNLLKDITQEVSQQIGTPLQFEQKTIDRLSWFKKQKQKRGVSADLKLAAFKKNDPSFYQAWATPTEVKVPYIAFEEVLANLDKIPEGTILNLVHQEDRHHEILVTSQGVVVKEKDRLFIRRALLGGKIQSSDLQAYLKNLMNKQNKNKPWPLIGVNLNQIL